jgi:hypothetical protein
MQWIQDAVAAVIGEFPEGKTLQRSGVVEKQVLLDFFQRGSQVFESEAFRQQVKECVRLRQSPEHFINESQKRIFDTLGVQVRAGAASDRGTRAFGQCPIRARSQPARVLRLTCQLQHTNL